MNIENAEIINFILFYFVSIAHETCVSSPGISNNENDEERKRRKERMRREMGMLYLLNKFLARTFLFRFKCSMMKTDIRAFLSLTN